MDDVDRHADDDEGGQQGGAPKDLRRGTGWYGMVRSDEDSTGAYGPPRLPSIGRTGAATSASCPSPRRSGIPFWVACTTGWVGIRKVWQPLSVRGSATHGIQCFAPLCSSLCLVWVAEKTWPRRTCGPTSVASTSPSGSSSWQRPSPRRTSATMSATT